MARQCCSRTDFLVTANYWHKPVLHYSLPNNIRHLDYLKIEIATKCWGGKIAKDAFPTFSESEFSTYPKSAKSITRNTPRNWGLLVGTMPKTGETQNFTISFLKIATR